MGDGFLRGKYAEAVPEKKGGSRAERGGGGEKPVIQIFVKKEDVEGSSGGSTVPLTKGP